MSTSASDAPVEGPRPFTITHDDHRGVVMCVSVLFIGYAFMTIALRLAARIRNMGIDDWLAVVGTVCRLLVFHVLSTDYNRSLPSPSLQSLLAQCPTCLEPHSTTIHRETWRRWPR